MPKPGKTGVSRIIDAFFYSMCGFKAAWRCEAAFRQEVVLALLLIPAAFWLASSHIELILLISSVLWVLMAELANSSVEAVVDRIGSEIHVLARRAKDIGSALVFVSLVLLATTWGIIIAHRLGGL
jgi:diacylglycerol kinase (ATP)